MKPVINRVLRCSLWVCLPVLWIAGQAGLPLLVEAADVHPVPLDGANLQLAERIRTAQADYLSARQAILQQINESFNIDYEALYRRYDARDREYRQQSAVVERIQDGPAKQRELEKLRAEFESPEYLRYAEAKLVLENELERNHLLRAASLQAYEEILDALINSDPILEYFFHSAEYRGSGGLLLKRVVWELSGGKSSSALPLTTYTVFADRTRTPFLIKVSPAAFSSLSFLRSIVLHELNHVLLYREPMFAGLDRPSSTDDSQPTKLSSSKYSLFFNLQYGGTTDYQYHLVHEYYAFKTQLLYDALAPDDPYHRLSPADRTHIEHLYEWSLGQLSGQFKAFVEEHPEPPLLPYIKRFLASQ